MPAEASLPRLEEAFAGVRSALAEWEAAPSRRMVVFGAIIRLNRELGPHVRKEGSFLGPFARLQTEVNAVTIGVKRGDAVDVKEAFARAEDTLRRIGGRSAR